MWQTDNMQVWGKGDENKLSHEPETKRRRRAIRQVGKGYEAQAIVPLLHGEARSGPAGNRHIAPTLTYSSGR